MIYPWHQNLWEFLISHRDTMPHAWLFCGKKGFGVEDFVRHYAKFLLCENFNKERMEPCHMCSSCHLFSLDTHPDFYELRPENSQKENERKTEIIKIEQIRSLIDHLQLSSHRGGMKIVWIYPAESMNLQAANALLKILEEPPHNTFFLVLSYLKDKLLPTILSRCHQLSFNVPSVPESLTFLKEKGFRNPEQVLAFYGMPLIEINPLEEDLRTKLVECLLHPRLIQLLDFASLFETQKLHFTLFLDWYYKWASDILLVISGFNAKFYIEYEDEMRNIAGKISNYSMIFHFDQVKRIKHYENSPLNSKLQIESLLISYLELLY